MNQSQTLTSKNYYHNEFGEPIEDIGGFTRNEDFWDCECETDYIHHYSEEVCPRCHAEYTEMPNARELEVRVWRENRTPFMRS